MVGILLSYWGGLFSGAMLVSGRVIKELPIVMHICDNLYIFISCKIGLLATVWAWNDSQALVLHKMPTSQAALAFLEEMEDVFLEVL